MKKVKVLFPFVEAGFGHIMTEKSIADAFEKKYGDYCEVIRCNFFQESGSLPMKKFEDRLCKEVHIYGKSRFYAQGSIFMMNLFGSKISSWFVMRALVRGAFKDSVKYMEELDPDVVISTHWASHYYAKFSSKKPMCIMHVPDAHANALFRYDADLTTISMKEGYERALRFKRRFNEDNLKLVPCAIRNQAYEVKGTKQEIRKRLGHDDKFTIFIIEGGYGIGMAERLCNRIIEEDLPISVNVICGKNPELTERLKALKSKGNTSLYVYGFCENPLELIASSDLYLGKSGNGLMEAAFFGVPIVVTRSANDIERLIAEHYVSEIKDAVRIFNLEKCLEFIKGAIGGSEQFEELKKHIKPREEFGGEGIADAIFEKINEKYNLR